MNTKKILFIGLSCVGDVVMTSTVIKTLQKQFPRATIDFVADKRSSNLYEQFPNLGKIVIKNKEVSINIFILRSVIFVKKANEKNKKMKIFV